MDEIQKLLDEYKRMLIHVDENHTGLICMGWKKAMAMVIEDLEKYLQNK